VELVEAVEERLEVPLRLSLLLLFEEDLLPTGGRGDGGSIVFIKVDGSLAMDDILMGSV